MLGLKPEKPYTCSLCWCLGRACPPPPNLQLVREAGVFVSWADIGKSKHSPRKPCFSDAFKKKYDSLLKTVYRLKPWPGNNFIIVSLWGGSAWAKCPIYTSWQYSLPDITKDKKAVGNCWGWRLKKKAIRLTYYSIRFVYNPIGKKKKSA